MESHRAQLERGLRRRGFSREDAEDAASEAILRAGRNNALDVTRAHRWLHVVARRVAVDAQRRRPNFALLSRMACHESVLVEPQLRIDDQLEAGWIADQADLLPERQRAVLHRRSEGMTLEEIATELGCSYKTVESLTSRARAKLRLAIAAAGALVAGALAGFRRGAPAISVVALVALAAVTLPHFAAAPEVSMNSGPAELRQAATRSADAGRAPRVTSQQVPVTSVRTPGLAPELRRVVIPIAPARRIGPAGHSKIEVTKSETDRTLSESVLDCLDRGVEISPQNIGCREAP